MSLEDLKEELKEVAEPAAVQPRDHERNGCHLEVGVRPEQVEAVARAARNADLFLESITAVDFTDSRQVIYHFNGYSEPSRVQVRVRLARDGSVPTISTVYDAALWHEREVFDLFGICFDNHPDMRRILLPDEADFHPLLKDFGKVYAFRKTEEIYGN
jgi:NADH-quinone oxidoreductase subunit C